MYKLVLIFVFVSFVGKINAHQYYFAFAEVEYNQMQEQLEGTIIFSTHDLEDVLLKNVIISSKFDKVQHDSTSIAKIGEFIFKSFKFIHKNVEIKLSSIDFFITRNGMLEFYFKSEKVKLIESIDVEFSSLMDNFPEQQNKITFIQNGQKQTAVFLLENKQKKLTIIS